MSFLRYIVGCCALLVCSIVEAQPELKKEYETVKPLLQTYCWKCHNHDNSQGDLNLERFETFEQAVEDKRVWDQVLSRYFTREMPPSGSPSPSDPERHILNYFLSEIVKDEGACNKIANDRNTNFYAGHVMSRRLTRTEYANAIRDLTGVTINAVERLPSDGSGGMGFDTTGDSLFLSPIHMEMYLDSAEIVSEQLWPDQHDAVASQKISPQIAAFREKYRADEVLSSELPREAAARILKPIIRLAFRRPLEENEIDRYLTMYDLAINHDKGHMAGMRFALQGVLVSPNFLFLAEPEPVDEGIYPLGDHPLATRLAMFIWSSLPDAELLDAADAGKLQHDETLKAQIHRMLKDPRAQALGDNFAIQWLGLGVLGGAIRPDSNKFPEFNDELAVAMKAETSTYVARLFMEDRSLLELLDSNYTYANEELAQIYGLENVTGDELRRVEFTDRNRGGVLTQASVLTVSSYPLRTSPVLRGRWLLEEILGSRVPPPPPDVPALTTESEEGLVLSIREQLERHRADPKCASCHDRMDPLGFGMENFDPIGRWRTDSGGYAIDSSGLLPSGESFTGPAEMKVILLNRKQEVLRHLARKMYGFAIGRNLNKFDDCVIKEAVERLEQNDYRASLLVEQIAMSYQFRHRFCKK